MSKELLKSTVALKEGNGSGGLSKNQIMKLERDKQNLPKDIKKQIIDMVSPSKDQKKKDWLAQSIVDIASKQKRKQFFV